MFGFLGGFVWKSLLKQLVTMIRESVVWLFWSITDEALVSIKEIAAENPCKILSLGGAMSFPGHRKRRFVLIFTLDKIAPDGFKKSRHLHKEVVEIGDEDVTLHVWLNTVGRNKHRRLKRQGRMLSLPEILL